MNSLAHRIIVVILSVIIIFSLNSCKMEDSYKEFELKNMNTDINEEWFVSDDYSFARIESVVIKPEIREVNHGEYVIYITAFSKSGTESVTLNECILKNSDKKLLHNELDTEMVFEESENHLYESWVEVGTFMSSEVENEDVYNLTVQAECVSGETLVSKPLHFQFVVKGYKSLVTPT